MDMGDILISPDSWHFVPAVKKQQLKSGTSDPSLKIVPMVHHFWISRDWYWQKISIAHCCRWFFNTHFVDYNSRCVIKQMTSSANKKNESCDLFNRSIDRTSKLHLTSKQKMQCLHLKCGYNLLPRNPQVHELESPRNAQQWTLRLETAMKVNIYTLVRRMHVIASICCTVPDKDHSSELNFCHPQWCQLQMHLLTALSET